MVGLAIVSSVLLLLTAVVVEVAARGRLTSNRLVGIRTRATMSGDAAWMAGHRAASPLTWTGVALCSVGAVGSLVVGGVLSDALAVGAIVVFIVTVIVALLRADRAAAAASRD